MRALGHEISPRSGTCPGRFHSSKETGRMESPLLHKRSQVGRAATIAGRVVLGALVIIAGASCKAAPTPQCLQFAADLMPPFAGGLVRKDLRLANACAVKSDQMVDSAGVKFPA